MIGSLSAHIDKNIIKNNNITTREFVHGVNMPYFPGVANGDFNEIQGRRPDTTHLLFLLSH